MGKYIVVNGCFRPEENNVGLVASADSLEEAKKICQANIVEDFSCGSYEKLLDELHPVG